MKRLLAAAVLAVSLHILLFSLGADRLIRRPPVWRPLPVTVMIAGISPQAAGGPQKAPALVSHAAAPAQKQQQLKPRRTAAKSTAKITRIKNTHRVPEPQRQQKPLPKPKKAAPLPPSPPAAAPVKLATTLSQPSSARPVSASTKTGILPRSLISRKSRSAGQSRNPTPASAASSVHVATPLYWRNPPPRYPALARQRRYTGTVILEVLVNEEGGANEVKVIKSTGYSLLDEAALEAVRRWRFRPGTEGGRPVAMRVKVPICFRLR